MKHRNLYFLVLAFVFFNFRIEAQRDCNNGTMVVVGEKAKKICFTRDAYPYARSYYTKYLIEVNSEEVYEIGFRVYKETDSILIQLYDKLRTKVKPVSITFNKVNDCYAIIKDYHVNEKEINDSAFVSILFNIPNEEEPFVNLNVFKDLSDETFYFLQKIQPDVLTRHINCVGVMEKSCDYFKVESNKNESSIKALTTKMTSYKEKELNKITDEIETIRTRPATDKATQELQERFNKKIDKIFLNQFGNYFTFENNDIDVEFNFKFDGYGKLKDIERSFKNGSQQNWFIDTLNLKIKPVIEKEDIPTISGQYNKPDLIFDFINLFKDSINYYDSIRQILSHRVKSCDSTFKLPDKNRSAFDETTNKIYEAFASFKSKPIGQPTSYPYNYIYSTTVSEVTGKWKSEKNEFDIKSGTLSQVLSSNKDEISNAFKKKFAPVNNEKYHIKICTLSINGEFMGLDIQLLE